MKLYLPTSKLAFLGFTLASFILFVISWGYGPLLGKLVFFTALLGRCVKMSQVLRKRIQTKASLLEIVFRGVFLATLLTFALIVFFVSPLGLDTWLTKVPQGVDKASIRQKSVGFISLSEPGNKLLGAFGEAIEGRRIVALGESHHLTAEYSMAKVALIRYMHEELGFDVLFFETPIAPLQLAMQRLNSDAKALSGIEGIFPIWHTKEVLALFEYTIETQSTTRPLQLIGIDPRHYLVSWKQANQFLDQVVANVDTVLMQEDIRERDLWYDIMLNQTVCATEDPRVAAGCAHYGKLATRLREEAKAIHESDPVRELNIILAAMVAEGHAESLKMQTMKTNEKFHARDRSMAKNITSLAEGFFSDKRIILWAHNFHLRKGQALLDAMNLDVYNIFNWWYYDRSPRLINTGSILSSHFGEEYYVLGLLTSGGEMGLMRKPHGWMPVRARRRDSIESILRPEKERAVFLNLVNLGELFSGNPLYFCTGGFSWQHGDIREQFDGVVVIDEVSPPNRLIVPPIL